MFSVRSALTNSRTEFSVWSARRLYNATLVIFGSQFPGHSQWRKNELCNLRSVATEAL
jgi:hypothetical protein